METKYISGKIPVELHQRMWEELERTGGKVSVFLEKVIEEHFIRQEEQMRRKQERNEVSRTLAITVPNSFFKRYQRCLEIEREKHEGRYTNKDFLTDIIRKKMEEIEQEAGISQENREEQPEAVVEEEAEESTAEFVEQEEIESDMGEEMGAGSEVSEETNTEEPENDEEETEVEEEDEAVTEAPEEECMGMTMG